MKPNIEWKGRIARAISGSLCVALGVAFWLLEWPGSTYVRWALIVLAIAGGGFQWYEAKRGWCIARACGIKTPM